MLAFYMFNDHDFKVFFAQIAGYIIAASINILYSLPQQCLETLKSFILTTLYIFGLNIYSHFNLVRAPHVQNL